MAQIHSKNSIATFTGKFIEPLEPNYEDIDIIDIAHGLSNICRYGGQSSEFYSVAQHSVYVSYNCGEDALNGLLHDGSEAYLGDVPRPIKHTPEYGFYRKVEDTLQTMIFQKYGQEPNLAGLYDGMVWESPKVKNADNLIILIEQQHLFKHPWRVKLEWSSLKYQGVDLLDNFELWTPRIAEQRFMDRFRELGGIV